MNRALVVSLAGLVALSGCETASLTSQYAFPEEGRAYHYGNFCGPGVPERVSEDPALQLEVLNTILGLRFNGSRLEMMGLDSAVAGATV